MPGGRPKALRFFLDTNVLAYCFDERAPEKQAKARALVREALDSSRGFVSWQVVQEFLNLATRKFAKAMTAEQARRFLDDVLNPMCEVYPGLVTMQAALDLHNRTQFSLYDCLILQAAIEAECDVLYSEDLQNGFQLHGLQVVNPF